MTLTKGSVLGLDIGGTKIGAVSLDAAGDVIGHAIAPTPAHEGPAAVIDAAARIVDEIAGRADAVAAGVAAAGVIDPQRGTVLSATDALSDWAGTPIASMLSERLGLPVVVDNDVLAAGLGEARLGAGRNARSMLFVAIGTGVGGALIIDGRAWHGASNVAGHLGHIAVCGADDMLCSCGRRGHLEAAASGPALVRQAAQLGITATDARQLLSFADAGNPAAVEVFQNAGRILGRTLGGLVNTVDVETVVVGGGLADSGTVLWEPLAAAFRAEILPPAKPTLVHSELGAQAGAIGAACLAIDARQQFVETAMS